MDFSMLGQVITNLVTVPAKMLGTLADLVEKLISKDGELWFANLKKFLRKEEGVWAKKVIWPVQLTTPFTDSDFFKEKLSKCKVVEDLEGGGFDPAQVVLEDCLEEGENSIKGELRLTRHKERRHSLLGAKAFLYYWGNQDQIPESWKKKNIIAFYGTVLDLNGSRFVLYLYWRDGAWNWSCTGLVNDWYAAGPSALAASA